MNKSRADVLHLGQFGGIRIACEPSLFENVKSCFAENGLPLSPVQCFSIGSTDRWSLIFNIAKQGKIAARVIMGLFAQKPDIEIVMHCCTADGNPQNRMSVKLKHSDDIEKCERLLEKCAQISFQTSQKSGD